MIRRMVPRNPLNHGLCITISVVTIAMVVTSLITQDNRSNLRELETKVNTIEAAQNRLTVLYNGLVLPDTTGTWIETTYRIKPDGSWTPVSYRTIQAPLYRPEAQ